MFEKLKKYKKIVVTGPQRSGTRLIAQAISQDTGHQYIDEIVTSNKIGHVMKHIDKLEPMVFQNPGLAHQADKFPPEVLIVYCMRSIKAILESEKRLGFVGSKAHKCELEKFNRKDGVISQIKYDLWEKQKNNIKHWKEVNYNDLKDHPMWVEPNKRKNWRWNRTK